MLAAPHVTPWEKAFYLSNLWVCFLQAYLARARQVCALNATEVKTQYPSDNEDPDYWAFCGDMLFAHTFITSLGLPATKQIKFSKSALDGDDEVKTDWPLGIALVKISA